MVIGHRAIHKFMLFISIFCFGSAGLGQLLEVELMSYFSTSTVFRGALIWPGSSLMAGPGFKLFDGKLKVYGPHVYYTDYLIQGDQFETLLDVGVQYFDDSEPMVKLTSHEKDFRNQRPSTLESFFRLKQKFGWRKLFSLEFSAFREMIRTHGAQIETGLKVPVLPFTSLAFDLGLGDKAMNSYLFGEGADSGLNFGSLGLTVVIPKLPWTGVIISSVKRTWLWQDGNRNADFVRGADIHTTFSSRWIWSF